MATLRSSTNCIDYFRCNISAMSQQGAINIEGNQPSIFRRNN